MAIFPKTPEDAVMAAVKIQEKVAEYNDHRQKTNRQPIKVGIGINTGPLMLGIIGDGRRTDTGVVADAVNAAARMEGLTKYYGVSIIVSDTTFAGIKNPEKYHFRFLDCVRVKGKKKEVSIYEIFNVDQEKLFEQKLKTKSLLEKGQQHYFAQEFAYAVKCFTDVLMLLPEDLTTKHYLERSSRLLLDGVAGDWENIRIKDHK
jgi:two-component system sensor histidine kinase ChiS